MNWLDGLTLTWHWNGGLGSNLGEPKLKPYFFGIFGFDLNMKS